MKSFRDLPFCQLDVKEKFEQNKKIADFKENTMSLFFQNYVYFSILNIFPPFLIDQQLVVCMFILDTTIT